MRVFQHSIALTALLAASAIVTAPAYSATDVGDTTTISTYDGGSTTNVPLSPTGIAVQTAGAVGCVVTSIFQPCIPLMNIPGQNTSPAPVPSIPDGVAPDGHY